MIKSFKCKETEKIFHRQSSRILPPTIQKIALRKLLILNASIKINDLRIPPSNRLEKLRGKIKNLYSIRINDQWRICFKWTNNDTYQVEIKDYH
jgi:proteic killer suppression protein